VIYEETAVLEAQIEKFGSSDEACDVTSVCGALIIMIEVLRDSPLTLQATTVRCYK
jgi:hypothetical protein